MIFAQPGETFYARADGFDSGLEGTIGVRIIDVTGTDVTARTTTDIIENPAGSGSYLASLTAPDTRGLYTVFWDSGSVTPSTTTGEQLIVAGFSAVVGPDGDSYVSTDELFRVLKVRTPTEEQTAAAERVLLAATLEIDAEIDRAEDADALSGSALALVQAVCLDRAADLWRHTESIPGVFGGLDDIAQPMPGRYSWARYAQRLAPLKQRWGLA